VRPRPWRLTALELDEPCDGRTATPARHEPPARTVTSGDREPAAPVPGAVLARTLVRQDPLASLQRQFRSCREWLPEGWYVACDY
jgi:hypothetical protein